jgi:hypothetical protein
MSFPLGHTTSVSVGHQAMLVVSHAQGRFNWSFQIGTDGSLTNGEPFYRLEARRLGGVAR